MLMKHQEGIEVLKEPDTVLLSKVVFLTAVCLLVIWLDRAQNTVDTCSQHTHSCLPPAATVV